MDNKQNRDYGNVAQICNYSAAYKGNFMQSLLALENRLATKGIKQIYILPARAKRTDANKWIKELRRNGHIIYIQSESFQENLKLFIKIKKEHNITVAFRHFTDSKTDILTRLVFGKQKVIRFFHGEFHPGNNLRFVFKKLLYSKETLVGVSNPVYEQIKKCFPGNQAVAIENSIDFQRLDNPDMLSTERGISCMTMGYNPFVKGADLAVKAVEKLQKNNNIHLYIVAASHLDELKKTICDVIDSIPKWLTILPPDENVSTYYSSMDIFLAPSRSEGFSYAVAEATYCKSTIVLSDIPAHRNLNVNKKYMFRSGDIDDFCSKLQLAIDELGTEQASADKDAAQKNAIASYGLDRWCDEVEKLI